MKPWKFLGEAQTPDGKKITLHEHDGDFSLRVAGAELMSTRQRQSEEDFGRLVADTSDKAPRVLIGGLGFGFTLRAALSVLPEKSEVVVAELIPAIVEWNRVYPLAGVALSDSRVRIFQGDVARAISEGDFSVILLDVDNGPEALTNSTNSQLYTEMSLKKIHRALRPGGRLVVWSVDSAPDFLKVLRKTGFQPSTHSSRASAGGGGKRTFLEGRKL